MRERAKQLGGQFAVESAFGQGTQMTITIPVEGALAKIRQGLVKLG